MGEELAVGVTCAVGDPLGVGLLDVVGLWAGRVGTEVGSWVAVVVGRWLGRGGAALEDAYVGLGVELLTVLAFGS